MSSWCKKRRLKRVLIKMKRMMLRRSRHFAMWVLAVVVMSVVRVVVVAPVAREVVGVVPGVGQRLVDAGSRGYTAPVNCRLASSA